MSWERSVAAWRRADTRMGDTIQRIAERELGNASRWPEIATLNDLVSPYIVDAVEDLQPRTLLAGLAIKIPAPQRAVSGVADPDDIFGTDLHLPDGRLRVTEAGDLELVSDAANLSQALRHRLDTHQRELVYHPTYGNQMHELLGQEQTSGTAMLAAAFADRALLADPRIVGTKDTAARVAGDAIRAEGIAIATDGRQLPVGGL